MQLDLFGTGHTQPPRLYRHRTTGELRLIRGDGLSFRVYPWQRLSQLLREAVDSGMLRQTGEPWQTSATIRWPDTAWEAIEPPKCEDNDGQNRASTAGTGAHQQW